MTSGTTPRILHFITALDYSGAPRGVLELIRAQQECGDVTPLLAILGGLEHAPTLPAELAEAVFAMEARFSPRRPIQALALARRLRRWIVDMRISLVHSHLPSADAVAALAVIGTGIPHLAHIRGQPPWFASRTMRDRYRRAFMRICLSAGRTRFVSVSQAAADYYLEYLVGETAEVRVVANGVDLSRFAVDEPLPEKSDVLVVGAAGRFSVEKNFELLLQAIATLAARGVALRLKLAGEGGCRAHYEELAKTLGVTKHIEFCGVLEDMERFYRSVDLFVSSSSSSEGMPRVLIEAGASGLPLVGTDVGGTRELIRHEETGLLVPAGNLEALVAAITRLVSDHELRERIRRAGWKLVVSNYGAFRVAREITEIYRSMLQEIDDTGSRD